MSRPSETQRVLRAHLKFVEVVLDRVTVRVEHCEVLHVVAQQDVMSAIICFARLIDARHSRVEFRNADGRTGKQFIDAWQ